MTAVGPARSPFSLCSKPGHRPRTSGRSRAAPRDPTLLEPVSFKGKVMGSIYWERKAHITWGKDWPGTLAENMRRENSDYGVIDSDVLPPGIKDVALLPGTRIFVCVPDYVPVVQKFLRYLVIKEKIADANGQAKGNTQAAVFALMNGEGRQDLETAKAEGDKILENDRLLENYVANTHNKANKTAVRRQRDACDNLFGKLDEIMTGIDDAT
jgi:uncharacterized protein DUF2130